MGSIEIADMPSVPTLLEASRAICSGQPVSCGAWRGTIQDGFNTKLLRPKGAGVHPGSTLAVDPHHPVGWCRRDS